MKKSTLDTLGLFAFLAVIIYAASTLLSRLGANMWFLQYIGDGLLLLVVLSMANYYTNRLHMIWKVLFYIIMVFAIYAYVATIMS